MSGERLLMVAVEIQVEGNIGSVCQQCFKGGLDVRWNEGTILHVTHTKT